MKTNDLFAPTESQLTVLSFGAGQDSSVLLEKYLDDSEFRAKYAPNDFVVIMSDTGDEFDETYKHVEYCQKRCDEEGVEFHFLTSDKGYHSESWLSLRHFYRLKNTIGSKMFPKTCTSRLKLQPIYRFLEHWLSEKYGVQCKNKKGIREFAARYGKIQMMIGIAKGEEKRMADASKNPNRWYRDSIENVYPLIDMGMERQACQDYLHAKDLYVIPSNCKACPFASLEEIEYLRRFYPAELADWIELEAAKLEKHKDRSAIIVTDEEGQVVLDKKGQPKTVNKNYGVFGVKALPVKIAEAKEAYADWSDDRVREYRYSHGHCVATTY